MTRVYRSRVAVETAFGRKVRETRRLLGWEGKQLAVVLGLKGSNLSDVERGFRFVSLTRMLDIIEVLDVLLAISPETMGIAAREAEEEAACPTDPDSSLYKRKYVAPEDDWEPAL